MQIESIQTGNLLNTSSRTFVTQSEVTAATGTTSMFGYSLGQFGGGASGSGVLALVRVRALVSGAPGLKLTDVLLTDPTSVRVPVELQFDGTRVFLPAVAR